MSGTADPAARVPTFRRGVKFRFDTVRDAWMVLAPERLFLPDAPGVEVLKLVDGVRNVGAIVDDLCTRFDAPREVVLADVATMAQDLADKGVLSW
jgi:pyrroloquinoline quinone biosynthesis protein D